MNTKDLEIPITTEILEKNGFETRGFWYVYTEKDEEISLCFEDEYIVSDLSKGNADVHFYPKYVHELQQAIRLIGITKEIDL